MVDLLKRWFSTFLNRGSISLEFPIMAGYVAIVSSSPTSDLAVFALVYSLFAWIESPFMMSDVVMIKTLHRGANFKEGVKRTLVLTMVPMLLIITTWLTSKQWLSLLKTESAALWSDALPYLCLMALALPISSARRALNGVATFHHKESVLRKGMWLKITLIAIVLLLSFITHASSVTGATLALVAGIWGETFYLYKKMHSIEITQKQLKKPVSMSSWIKELSPFALMSFVSLGIGAIVTIALSLGAKPEEAVAIFSLLNGIITIFKHAPMSIQSIWVNALNRGGVEKSMMTRLFVFVFCLTLAVLLIYYLGFNHPYMYRFNNISLDAYNTVFLVFTLLSTSVLMTFFVIFYRGLMIHENQNKQLNKATMLEFFSFITTALLLIFGMSINSAVACAGAICIGRLSAIVLMKISLTWTFREEKLQGG